jgi:hypothetical protein
MRDWFSRGNTGVAKIDAALWKQGRYLSVEEAEVMLLVKMRFNLAIHIPVRWIAALFTY